MRISELVEKFPHLQIRDLELSSEVIGISHDNRDVSVGFVFAALPGFNRHGAEFAAAAIAAKSVAVLTDAAGAELFSGPALISENPRKDMGLIAREIYQNSQSRLLKFAVTGTNGKTTTTNMIAAMLGCLEKRPVLIGTNGIFFDSKSFPAKRTTPESSELHQILQQAEAADCDSLTMEVSSHALELFRVEGIQYEVSIFTGLTQDHLDFHGTMDAYFAAKAKLFTPAHSIRAVINIDTEWGEKLSAQTTIPHVTYGFSAAADWQVKKVEVVLDGRTSFEVKSPNGTYQVSLNMPGDFNISNSVAAIAAIDAVGLDVERAISALATVNVSGRLQRIDMGQPFQIFVDYAHTPDAVERAVAVGKKQATGKVITVIGCGGDRDAVKRPLMGAAAASGDVIFVTDDNPRSEDPALIRNAIRSGIPAELNDSTFEVADRRAAIQSAISTAEAGDCVLILGKGHEQGQEVNGVVQPFSDVKVTTEILRDLGWVNNG